MCARLGRRCTGASSPAELARRLAILVRRRGCAVRTSRPRAQWRHSGARARVRASGGSPRRARACGCACVRAGRLRSAQLAGGRRGERRERRQRSELAFLVALLAPWRSHSASRPALLALSDSHSLSHTHTHTRTRIRSRSLARAPL